MGRKWQKLLDDLEPGDSIEVDLGAVLVKGRYDSISRSKSGKWFLFVKSRKRTEEIPTRDICEIRRLAS